MRKNFTVFAILFLLWSCSPWNDDYDEPGPMPTEDGGVQIPLKCRHEAILAYLVFQEYYETQICSGPSRFAGFDHAQARAKINGEWMWLTLIDGSIFTTSQDPFTVLSTGVPVEAALTWCDIYVCDSPLD